MIARAAVRLFMASYKGPLLLEGGGALFYWKGTTVRPKQLLRTLLQVYYVKDAFYLPNFFSNTI